MAYYFGNLDFEIWVEGVGQDTFQPFEGGFGSMRAMLPMWGLGAKMGPKIKILNKGDNALILSQFDLSRKKQAFKKKSKSNE